MKYHDDEEEKKVLDDDKRILIQPLCSLALSRVADWQMRRRTSFEYLNIRLRSCSCVHIPTWLWKRTYIKQNILIGVIYTISKR